MPFRRSYERFDYNLPISLTVGKEAGLPILLKDLSSRGAGIHTNFTIVLDQEIQIQIREPFAGTPFTKSAKVVWSKQINANLWCYGLDFGQDSLLEMPL